MIESLKNMLEGSLVGQKVKFIKTTASAATYLNVNEQIVRVNPASGSALIYLPNALEAMGRIYDIGMINSAKGVRVDDGGEAGLAATTVSATSKLLTLFSTGDKWRTLAS